MLRKDAGKKPHLLKTDQLMINMCSGWALGSILSNGCRHLWETMQWTDVRLMLGFKRHTWRSIYTKPTRIGTVESAIFN